MKKFVMTSALLLTMVQANVTINSASYQEQIKINKSGEKVKEWVVASKVVPGTVIRYVNTLVNSEEQAASQLLITNPIPENMEYVANSASCASECLLSYSVDGGKSYAQPAELYVGEGMKRHLAQASEYTDIRWVVKTLPASSQSSVEYKARLK